MPILSSIWDPVSVWIILEWGYVFSSCYRLDVCINLVVEYISHEFYMWVCTVAYTYAATLLSSCHLWPRLQTLINYRISNHIHYKKWDEITHLFLDFNGATVQLLKFRNGWVISSHIFLGKNYLSMVGIKLIRVSKRANSIRSEYIFVCVWHELCLMLHRTTQAIRLSHITIPSTFVFSEELFRHGFDMTQQTCTRISDSFLSCCSSEVYAGIRYNH